MQYKVEEVKEVIDTLDDKYGILDWYCNTDGESPLYCGSPNALDGIPLEADGKCYNLLRGATKLVIVPSDSTYVIKIPSFNGDIDYCRREARLYQIAKKEGLNKNFAEVNFVGEFFRKGTFCSVYVAEKANCGSVMVEETAYKEAEEEAKNIEGGFVEANEVLADYDDYMFDREVGYLMFQNFGAEGYARMCDFIDDNKINDLHSGNVGWIGDRFVLIDYSGFGEDVVQSEVDFVTNEEFTEEDV